VALGVSSRGQPVRPFKVPNEMAEALYADGCRHFLDAQKCGLQKMLRALQA